jgi:DNA-binding beta-propeller fold protein YncE
LGQHEELIFCAKILRFSGAMRMAVSPDQRTLLVLTSGYNRLSNWLGQLVDNAFTEYVFVYDISNPLPVKKQIIRIPDSFAGIAFSPDRRKFYVGGGRHDNIYVYALRTNGSWAEAGSSIELEHKGANGLYREKTPSVTEGFH